MAKEFGNKSSQTKVLLILLGITVMYQGMYHICITLPFSMDEYFAQQRGRTMADAIHPCHGETASQGQCAESELFRSWSQSNDPAESVEQWVSHSIGDEENGPDLMALDPLGRVTGTGQSSPTDLFYNSTPALESAGLSYNSTPALESAPLAKVEYSSPVASESQVELTPAAVQPLESQAKAESKGSESTHVSSLIKGSRYESTEWGRGLIELEAQLGELTTKHDENRKKRLANSNLKQHMAEVKERSLLEKIEDLLREMCEDPMRRGRETCARFLSPKERHEAAKANLQSRLKKLANGRLEWERSFVKRARNLGKQMCMARHSNSTLCQQFLTDVPVSSPQRILSMAFAHDSATQSAAEISKRKNEPTSVDGKVLRASKWAGMIPKVACIMTVPNTTSAHARVKYAINNFLEQNYEGPTQLVMVYHYQDQQTAHLLRRFADGAYVKAVPARTSVPSTTAFRYGAWVAGNDADVVARWDLDAWHHPNRLAMQVRALGLTGLPVSLLKQRTLVTDDGHTPVTYLKDGFRGTSSVGFGWPESLVAERSWAEKNWAPLLINEGSSLASSPGLVSLLDMPELQAYSIDDSLKQSELN